MDKQKIKYKVALEEIKNICEGTPEGSRPELLDDALNEVAEVCDDVLKK